MKIIVTGATGLIGRPLCGLLMDAGHQVVVFSRDVVKARTVLGAKIESVAWGGQAGPEWKAAIAKTATASVRTSDGAFIRFLRSGNDFFHHAPAHIRQPEITAGISVGQFLVIQSQLIQDRRMKIVHVDFILHGAMTEVVGCAVGKAGLHTATGQPGGETTGVVVATRRVL